MATPTWQGYSMVPPGYAPVGYAGPSPMAPVNGGPTEKPNGRGRDTPGLPYRIGGWIQLVVLLLALAVDIVVIIAPYWTFMHTTYPEEFTEYSGLWWDCKVFGYKEPDCNRFDLFKLPAYYRWTQSLLLLATVNTLIAFVAGILVHCTTAYFHSKWLVRLQSLLVFSACMPNGVARFLALFIYSSTNYYDVNQIWWGVGVAWCFWLLLAGEVLYVLAVLYQVLLVLRDCT